MYLTRSIMKTGSKNVTWEQEEEEGYDYLILMSIISKRAKIERE